MEVTHELFSLHNGKVIQYSREGEADCRATLTIGGNKNELMECCSGTSLGVV